MCPACLATVATIVTGAASAGGIATFLIVTLRRKPAAPSGSPTPQSQGDEHESTENHLSR
jgi:hypothetical protein